MKRSLAVVFVFALLFSLSACCLKHDYTDWNVTVEPSYLSEGTRVKTCSRCGETVTEEVPRLSTDNCMIVDDSGMTVTAEECFYLLEEVLNRKTNYYIYGYSDFHFAKTESEYARKLYVNDNKSSVSVFLFKQGHKVGANDKIDQIQIAFTMPASSSNNYSRHWEIFSTCATAAIMITHDLYRGDYYSSSGFLIRLGDKVDSGTWERSGKVEYGMSTIGNLLFFDIKVAD